MRLNADRHTARPLSDSVLCTDDSVSTARHALVPTSGCSAATMRATGSLAVGSSAGATATRDTVLTNGANTDGSACKSKTLLKHISVGTDLDSYLLSQHVTQRHQQKMLCRDCRPAARSNRGRRQRQQA